MQKSCCATFFKFREKFLIFKKNFPKRISSNFRKNHKLVHENFLTQYFWKKKHFDENSFDYIFLLHTYIGTKVHRYTLLHFSTLLKCFWWKKRYVFTLFFFETSCGLICRFPKFWITEIPKIQNVIVTWGVENFEIIDNFWKFIDNFWKSSFADFPNHELAKFWKSQM